MSERGFMTPRLRSLLAGGLAIGGLLLAGSAPAQTPPVLHGTTGPGFTISLTDATGARVSHLDPGTYTIVVEDKSDQHNFHLQGPGVNQRTEIDATGTVTWTVTITDGKYTYLCDAHPTQMHGSFTAGNFVEPPPKPKLKGKLVATTGPGYSISLKRSTGKVVKTLARGLYQITVRDKSNLHNFHLVGPGVSKKTKIGTVGTATWKVTLKKGLYRFVCDAHVKQMHGSFRVT
jgi:plastocyanin